MEGCDGFCSPFFSHPKLSPFSTVFLNILSARSSSKWWNARLNSLITLGGVVVPVLVLVCTGGASGTATDAFEKSRSLEGALAASTGLATKLRLELFLQAAVQAARCGRRSVSTNFTGFCCSRSSFWFPSSCRLRSLLSLLLSFLALSRIRLFNSRSM